MRQLYRELLFLPYHQGRWAWLGNTGLGHYEFFPIKVFPNAFSHQHPPEFQKSQIPIFYKIGVRVKFNIMGLG